MAPLPQTSIKVGPFTITFGKAMNAKGLIETRPTVLVVSTHGAKGLKLDLDGTAANGKETSWDVPAGATVRSTALIPHMKPFFSNNTATVDLSWVAPAKFKIKGSFKAKVPMIRPEYGVPAIRSLDLTEVFVELTLPSGDIVIGGKAALQVYDRAKKVSHLSGLAQFEMDAPDPKAVPAKPGRVGGTIALNGLWKNPFWIPNFALFNIGLSAKFPAGSSVPTAIGYNGQGLWLKGAMDGKWPKLKANKLNSPVGVKADGSLMTTLPSNVETIGSTVYVDTVPGDSGICAAPGVCAKMPELLLRLDAQNVSPVEMTKRTNFLLAALKKLLAEAKVVRTYDPKTQKATQTKAPWAELAKVIPVNKTLSTPKLGPIPFSLDRFFFYVHTNSMQRFGLDWPFGFRMAADARFKPPAGPDKGKEKKVKLFGDMNLLGATLGGWMSPLQLLPGVKLVGDPFRRHVLLKGGSVQIPVKSESSQWGTFEGWFNGTKYVQGSGGAVLFSRRGGQHSLGVDVTAKELAPACVPGAVDINGKKRDCKTPIARVVVTVKTGDSKVKPLQRTRVMKTRFGVLQPGQSHHVAVVRNLKTHIYKVFVDGNEAALLDTANGKDGIPGTKDDLDRFASPTVSAPITMGQKFHHIDDMRLWKSERTQDQLRRGALALPKGFHTDKGLIARWQVDFDRKDDVSNGVMMMRNSRLNAAAAWHGKYLSGAAAVIDPNNQDLYFALNLALNNPAANGWSLRAGLDIKLPKAFRTLSGNPEGIAMAAEIAYAENTLSGKLFMRQLTLVPIPTKGGLVLTGAGPDGQTGTFDDGVLAEAKFTYPSTSGFSGEALPNIDTSLQLAIDWNGKRSPILGSTLRLGCLKADKKAGALFTGKTCTLGSGYHVFTRTTAGKTGGLNVDLGGGLGKLGITGSFELSTLNKPVAMNVQGGVTVFGKKIANALLRLDKSGFKAETDLKLGSLNGVEFGAATKISVAYTWKPARLCASGKTKLAVPALATFDGTLSACFGTNPTASFSGTAKAGTFGGVPLADLAVKLDATKGLHITKAKLKIPNIFDANLSGYYKNAKSFDLTGKSTVLPGKGKLLKFVNTVAMSRSSNAATKLSSAMTVSSPTKWVSSAIKGSLQYAGGQWYWALAGSATLKPFGFKLTSGRFWACNPLSKTAKSNPPECKTTTGFGASATLNLGIAKVKIKGAVALNIKIGTGRYDKVELTGKLTTKFRKVFSFTGTPTLTMTAPIRSGHNQLKLTSKLTAFSVTSTQNLTLKAGTNGLPKSFTLTASGSLKPYAGVTLSGGKAYYKWSGAGSSASATGSLNLSPVVTTKVSAVISTSGAYAFTGTGEVRMANLMKKSTSVTMSSSGVAVNSSMTADTYVADLTGTINGNVPYNKAFSFSSTGKLKLSGFPEASVGNFKAHYTSGVSGTASVNMKIMNMSVTATASPNSTGLTLSGSQSYNWNLGSIPGFSYFVTVTEWFAAAVSGWSCSCGLDIPPCKCTQSQKKYKSKGVSGSVKFTLSGTSYGTSSNVQLKATATLTAGLSATASTTCNMSLNPQCCFSFPSPVGKQCLKLY
ncbi:MAG: hypothetical protein KC502_16410 [Myxococcales bacterium]|nr:hypothetical protein [Myxococcales bacterium]